MNELSNWIGVPYLKKYIEKRVDILQNEMNELEETENNFYHLKGQLDELKELLSFLKKFQLGERI